MSQSLRKYFQLMKTHPYLFLNLNAPGEVQIITARQEILREHARLQAKVVSDGKPKDWVKIGVLSEDAWFWVIRDLVRFPDGKIGAYLRLVNRKNQQGGWGVIILPVLKGRVLLLRHYRHEERNFCWEFPHGFGEPGTSAVENARLELQEEIGVSPFKLTELGREPGISGSNGGNVYFLAELSAEAEISVDRSEGIAEYCLLPLEELEAWIVDGRFTDLLSIKAYALAKIKRLI